MKCPKCGEELEDGAAFCTNCGEKLATVCPKCGKTLKPGAKFCSSCGANLAELAAEADKPSVCPNCGAELEPDEKFCSQCGAEVVTEHAATTEQVVMNQVKGHESQDAQQQATDIDTFYVIKIGNRFVLNGLKDTSLTQIVIPDMFTNIGECAFFNCSSLKSVVIPNSVMTIGNSAFYGCSSLESVVIPDSVTHIGDCAFESCESLKSVIIPHSTSVDVYAFDKNTRIIRE